MGLTNILGRGRQPASRAEDARAEDARAEDEDKREDEREDEDEAQAAAEDGQAADSQTAGDRRDDDDDKDMRAAEDDDEGGGAEGDEDDEDDDAPSAEAAAERRRIAAILTAPEAKGRRKLAEHFAFRTNVGPKAAVAALKAAPAATGKSGGRLDQAMRTLGNPEIGPDAGGDQPGAAAAGKSWDRALAKVSTTNGVRDANGWDRSISRAQGGR